MIAPALSRRSDELRTARTPFVVATVVRAQRPTSVRPGDAALVLGDGTIEGFVGGSCAEQSVRLHALRALETGEALLLRILPGRRRRPAPPRARSPCRTRACPADRWRSSWSRSSSRRGCSSSARPRSRARWCGWARELDLELVATPGAAVAPAESDLALVVAAHGRDELIALRSALDAGLPYVGLVASRVRGAAVVEELRAEGVAEERLADLETPAGLDIGARTPNEIALSILARIVAVRRGGQQLTVRVVAPATASATAIDPVCGMVVAAADETPHVDHEGRRVYFCCDGCRDSWTRSHALE